MPRLKAGAEDTNRSFWKVKAGSRRSVFAPTREAAARLTQRHRFQHLVVRHHEAAAVEQLLVHMTRYVFGAVHASEHHAGAELQLQQGRDLLKAERLQRTQLPFSSRSWGTRGAHPVLSASPQHS